MIHRRGRRDTLPVNAEINLTNLIDIAFVLLIIFMITAPILQGGVDVELPKGEAVPLESSDGVIVTIDKDGLIYIDKTRIAVEDLGVQMKRLTAAGKMVSIRGDTNGRYGPVARVLAILQQQGITDFNLVIDPIAAE
jgi:biopolymer transport protein TolR